MLTQPYFSLLSQVMQAPLTSNRTGVKAHEDFGLHATYPSIGRSIPLLVEKRVPFKAVVGELLWFLKGRTDNQWLNEHGITIWNEWATADKCAKFGRAEGDLGPIYGKQWRSFGASGVDQIQRVIDEIKSNPRSRRLVVSAWNPEEVDRVELPPCHTLFQFQVEGEHTLNCQLYQRSADMFLGVPFNIASYAILMRIIAIECGLEVGTLHHCIGSAHLYENHVEQAKVLMERHGRIFASPKHPVPILDVRPRQHFSEYEIEDFSVSGYYPLSSLPAEVAV